MTKIVLIVATLAVVGGSAAEARAQNQDDARGSIERAAKKGDRLTITTLDGAAVRGHLVRMDTESLVLRTGDAERSLPYADIDRIRRRQNGIIAGATAGGLVGALWGSMMALTLGDDVDAGTAVGTMTAIGLGIGIGLDALISTNRTIFKRTAVTHGVNIQPRQRGGAVLWSARW